MKETDKLRVLPFSQPAPTSHRAKPKDPKDDLARAMAALQSALEAELYRPKPESDTKHPNEDSFTPIGTPTWRAGRDDPKRRPGRAGVAESAVARAGPSTDKDALARRITALHLPRFAIERWHRWAKTQPDAPPEDAPLVLTIEGHHGPIIHATNRAADLEGIHIDMNDLTSLRFWS